jgi:hypothetical protein
MRYAIIAALVLVGCADKHEPAPALVKTASAPIVTANGTLTTIEVPVGSLGAMHESQTCFLWRDAEYKTAALQCPNDRRSYTIDPE